MLEPPAISVQDITACLRTSFDLSVARLTFLPLGADANAAVYEAIDPAGGRHFVKLHRGAHNPTVLMLQRLMCDLGNACIIGPRLTVDAALSARLGEFTLTCQPFIDGDNGFRAVMTAQQWQMFGRALRQVHTLQLPDALRKTIPAETFGAHDRDRMRLFLDRIASERFAEPVTKQLAMFLNSKRDDILDMIARAEHFAALLQALPPPNVLCHADIHGGNLMISPTGPIYLVDWDAPVFAPKERDLMFIGGGLGFAGCTPRDEVRLFYPGYGPDVIDAHAADPSPTIDGL